MPSPLPPLVEAEIQSPLGKIKCVFAHVPGSTLGVVMVAGAGGGLSGPGNIYPDLARQFQSSRISSLILDYRFCGNLNACVPDTLAGVTILEQMGVKQVVLIGWSFGGAVVITAGAKSNTVVGVATVASQTAGTLGADLLAPRSLLLLHGTGDTCLNVKCSEQIYARAGQPKKLIKFHGDNHGITNHREEVMETIMEWAQELFKKGQAQESESKR